MCVRERVCVCESVKRVCECVCVHVPCVMFMSVCLCNCMYYTYVCMRTQKHVSKSALDRVFQS